MWLGTYECMKSTLQTLFFQLEKGLPEWIFHIWPKNFKSDRVLVYMKKSCFWAFWGPAKVSRPLVNTKEGARGEKTPEKLYWQLWLGQTVQSKHLARSAPQSQKILILLAKATKTNFCSSANPVLGFFEILEARKFLVETYDHTMSNGNFKFSVA